MKKLKQILAVLMMAALFTVSGSESVPAADSGRSDLVIVIDAGHGGYDGGASGNGLTEKILTLKIAQYCKAELEKYQGVKVYMTRSMDVFVGLDQRVSIAASKKADAFVSIHINSAAAATASGAEVFYPNSGYKPKIGTQGKKLASAIQNKLVALGLRNRGIKTMNSMIGSKYPDGSAADYYAVIRGSKNAGFPGVIVEHAFISNSYDAKMFLGSSAALKKLGAADAQGIAACYGLKKAGETSQKLSKTKLTKLVGKTSSSVLVGWQKVKGAGGYEIYRSASKNGVYSRIASVKKAGTVSYKDKSVAAGKTYFYKVRPYKMEGGRKVTAGFCTPQKVKLLKKPDVSVNAQAARAKIKWKQVNGALQYEVYRSTSKNGKYQKIATVKEKFSFQDTNRKSNIKYYYKVRAAGSGIQGKTFSSYSAAK